MLHGNQMRELEISASDTNNLVDGPTDDLRLLRIGRGGRTWGSSVRNSLQNELLGSGDCPEGKVGGIAQCGPLERVTTLAHRSTGLGSRGGIGSRVRASTLNLQDDWVSRS